MDSKFIEQEADGIYTRSRHYNLPYSESPYYRVWEQILKYVCGSVIDLGCGPGQFLEMCLKHGITKYTGYDISLVAIMKAEYIKAKYKADIYPYIVDLHKTDLLKEFKLKEGSTYVLCEILEHIEDDGYILSLIPKGENVIITLPNYLGGSHVRKFDTKEEIEERYHSDIKFSSFDVCPMGNEGKIIVCNGLKK